MACVIAGSRSFLILAEFFCAAELLVFGGCFWATAQGAASIRSAVKRFRVILERQHRSNIRSLIENLTTIPRDSKYNYVALATFVNPIGEKENADLPGMRYRPRFGRGRN